MGSHSSSGNVWLPPPLSASIVELWCQPCSGRFKSLRARWPFQAIPSRRTQSWYFCKMKDSRPFKRFQEFLGQAYSLPPPCVTRQECRRASYISWNVSSAACNLGRCCRARTGWALTRIHRGMLPKLPVCVVERGQVTIRLIDFGLQEPRCKLKASGAS